MKKIRVLIADDHMIVRQGLRQLLATALDMDVVGEADTGETAVREARKLKPNVVLLDIAMPLLNGIAAARQIHERVPSTAILMLSTYHQDQEVREAMAAGAHGYVMKESASSELLKAVRALAAGQAFFSPGISRRMVRQIRGAFLAKGEPALPAADLTSRELEVLRLVAEGNGNRQTGEKLGISIKTVEKHRQALMNKLNIHEAASLTRYAIAKRVVPCARPALVSLNSATDVLNVAAAATSQPLTAEIPGSMKVV